MMELGSEYNLSLNNLNVVEDNIFNYLSGYGHTYYFDSGRSALRYLVKQLKQYNKVLLPEFMCESVNNCFDESQTQFYKLRDDFSIDLNDLRRFNIDSHTIIFLMHYFGTLQQHDLLSEIRSLVDHSGAVIIEDTTHSIFTQTQTIGDYMICSLRKWLPISGGGVLYFGQNRCEIKEPDCQKGVENNRSYGMILKDMFLFTEFDCNLEYRRIFEESEKRLDEQISIYKISDFSKFLASCVSVEQLKNKRKKNFKQLANNLRKLDVSPAIKYGQYDTPFVYPLRVRDRNKLRSFLISNKIYCAVHWPFDNHKPEQRPFAKRNAYELISLPIDQRYDEVHIEYLIDTVRQYGGDLLF